MEPIRVESFNSFQINELKTFNIFLLDSLKTENVKIEIENSIQSQLDYKLVLYPKDQTLGEFIKGQVSFIAPVVDAYTIKINIINSDKNFYTQFYAKAYDLSKVAIKNSTGKCYINEKYEFEVDASEAGQGQLEIAVNEGEIPNQVQVLDNGRCLVNFSPEEAIPHIVDIKFNGHNVIGCPFRVDVKSMNDGYESPKLIKDENIQINTKSRITLQNIKINITDHEDFCIIGPLGQIVDYSIERVDDSVSFVFTPNIVGDYSVEIKSSLACQLPASIIESFPLQLKVFDSNQVIVSDLSDGSINHPIYFFIDASQAGSGNLEIRVASETKNLPNHPQTEANARIRVSFVPNEPVEHLIDVKFNGESVPNSPFYIQVHEEPIAQLQENQLKTLRFIAVNKLYRLHIDRNLNSTNKNISSYTLKKEDCHAFILNPSFEQFKLDDIRLSEDNQSFVVEFSVKQVGPHKVFLFVKNQILPSSPIICNAYNIDEVLVSFDADNQVFSNQDLPIATLNKPFTFSVNALKAGEGTLALAVVANNSGNPVQANINVSEKSQGLYNLTFIPTEFATHSIDMSFNDQTLPKSPFLIEIVDNEGRSSVSSPKSNQTDQQIKNESNSQGIQENRNDNSALESTSGIEIKQNDKIIEKKNIAYGLIKVTNIVYLEYGILEDSNYKIDINGPLNVKVSFKLIKEKENQQAYLEYKPKSIGTHEIIVSDNAGNILRRYYVEIFDPSLVRLSHSDTNKEYQVGKTVTVILDSSNAGKIQLDSIKIFGPKQSHKKSKDNEYSFLNRFKSMSVASESDTLDCSNEDYYTNLTVTKESDDINIIRFTPLISGSFTVEVKCLSQHINNSPFSIDVKDLSNGKSKKNIESPSFNQDTKYKSTPRSTGKQQTSTQDHDEQILEYIAVHGLSLKHAPINSKSAFIIEANKLASARDFDVLISDPRNNLVDVRCYLREDGNLLAEWSPRRIGTHQIEVLYKGMQVPKSPFKSEAFDPSQVIISNLESSQFKIGERIEFELIRKNAGHAELDVSIVNPSGENLPVQVKPLNEGSIGETVNFTPPIPGKYKILILFGGFEIPKSPIKLIVHGDNQPEIKISGSKLNYAEVNKTCQFIVTRDPKINDLGVKIECEGKAVEHVIEKCNASFVVKYKPTKVGYITIMLYIDGVQYERCPFKIPVIDFSKFVFVNGTNKLNAKNSGTLQRSFIYEQDTPREFIIDASSCGPGELVAEAYCRANTNLKYKLQTLKSYDDIFKVTFVCPPQQKHLPDGMNVKDFSTKATYIIRFYYCNVLVPETLMCVVVEPKIDESNPQSQKLSLSDVENNNSNIMNEMSAFNHNEIADCPVVALRGHGLAHARCGEEAEFTIDGCKIGTGKPEVFITNNDKLITTHLTKLSSNVYKVVYIPQTSGVYLLNVLWDKKQVAGCPISINVLPLCDATKVVCTGDGLKGGIFGEEIKTFIDTRRAGPGELTACCNGPNKVALCELLDRGNGTFILYIKPQESGRHYLSIKYGGTHIPESPFSIRVSGKPDPTKVRVYGPGIEHGILSTYQSKFMCDTRGAGAGQLTVRIRGPKGAFRMETQREGQRERTILCKYDPTEPGDYGIEIKWSGQHVPGSPFVVMIFDTEEELLRYSYPIYLSLFLYILIGLTVISFPLRA